MTISESTSKKRFSFYFIASVIAIVGGFGLLIHTFIGAGSNVRGEDEVVAPDDNEEAPVPLEPLTFNDPDSQLIEVFVTADNKNRRFNVFVPGSYFRTQAAVPMVFVWHGLSQTAEGIQRQYQMDPVAEQENFIVIYPDGIGNSFDIFRINGNYDLLLTEEILNYMTQNFRIKQSSIYSTGYSNGGFMSTLIACEFSTRFAAVAPIAGTFAADVLSKCSPTATVPYLQIHGTRDFVIPLNGNIAFESVDDTLAFWAQKNGQQGTPQITELNGGDIQFYSYQPDDIVQHYRMVDKTHDNIVESIPAQTIIDFFKSVSNF